MPGGAILAGTAALRAGAGKLKIATSERVATAVATAVPEAHVLSLRMSGAGVPSSGAIEALTDCAAGADAVLIGPGMVGEDGMRRWLPAVLARLAKTTSGTVVLDAATLALLGRRPRVLSPFHGRAILTPHAGEMATLCGLTKGDVERAPRELAAAMSRKLGAVVALKGAVTFVAGPGGELFRNEAGNVGLATCGSGDVLAGIVAGLAGRGADPLRATAWAVHVHARCSIALARRRGGALGLLARELLDDVPGILASLSRGRSR
jgi:hydroxyethylthiazole kinase-like uncharacterized protein yjeF